MQVPEYYYSFRFLLHRVDLRPSLHRLTSGVPALIYFLRQPHQHVPDGDIGRIQNQIEHDPKTQTIVVEHIYQVIDDQGVSEEYPDRLELGYLYPKQANQLFSSNGFFIEQIYGDYDFQPLQTDIKKEQIYILKKLAG